MKKSNEMKVTLTVGQLRKLIKESIGAEDMPVTEDAPAKPFRASELGKYGFTHDKADDFSDDGNRFYVYRLKGTNMGVSYLRHGNEIYLAGRPFDEVRRSMDELGYDEFSKLPGYRELDMFNGVSDTEITPEGIQKLIKALNDFEKAVFDAASQVQGTDAEATEGLNRRVQEIVEQSYNELKAEFARALDSIVSKTYEKSFDFYITHILRELSGIRSLNRPITSGSRSEYDRKRVQDPEKTVADLEKSIGMYSRSFHEYLDRLTQL